MMLTTNTRKREYRQALQNADAALQAAEANLAELLALWPDAAVFKAMYTGQVTDDPNVFYVGLPEGVIGFMRHLIQQDEEAIQDGKIDPRITKEDSEEKTIFVVERPWDEFGNVGFVRSGPYEEHQGRIYPVIAGKLYSPLPEYPNMLNLRVEEPVEIQRSWPSVSMRFFVEVEGPARWISREELHSIWAGVGLLPLRYQSS